MYATALVGRESDFGEAGYQLNWHPTSSELYQLKLRDQANYSDFGPYSPS
jgi:hypothetical protein